MRAPVVALLLAAAAFADDPWTFAFENGDRVRGGFAGMRDGRVLLEMQASARAVAVPFAEIATAEPLPRGAEKPRPAVQVVRLRDGGALLGRCLAIRQGRLEFEAESLGTVSIPGREIAELLPAEDAVRAYYRSVTDRPSLDGALSAERFDALWTRLGWQDGNVAWEAQRGLVRAGADAVTQLGARLRVQPDAPEVVLGWIRSLDADSAEVRAIAFARLRALGETAAPSLRTAMRKANSAEARQRISALLAAPDPEGASDEEVTRFLRAIRILEEIGTPDAAAILERLANGAPGAPTGLEAEAVLERLRRARR